MTHGNKYLDNPSIIKISKNGWYYLFFKNSTSLLIYNEDTGNKNRKKYIRREMVK